MAGLLAIECSTPQASLALLRGDEIVAERAFQSDRHHHALLFAPMAELLDEAGPDRLDEIVVGTGPGSYSGTRVGIAAAQGIGLVHGCGVVGLSSLAALGIDDGLVIGDARRGSAWRARLGNGLPDPQLVAVEDLTKEISGPVHALEDVARLGLPESVEVRRVAPTAGLLAAAWLSLDEATRDALRREPPQPAYLRPPHITEAKKGHPLLRRGG